MKKIKGEFLTAREANIAMDKIKPYCGNVKIIYGENYIPDEYELHFPRMNSINSFNFGNFGIMPNLNFSPYNLDDKYTGNYYQSERTTLQADVADDNYEYVREKLYFYGATTVA